MVGGADTECGWAVGVNRGARLPWSSEARRRAEGRAAGGTMEKRETESFSLLKHDASASGGPRWVKGTGTQATGEKIFSFFSETLSKLRFFGTS
jgi:hypothetical protein